jgi:hypothetical protein
VHANAIFSAHACKEGRAGTAARGAVRKHNRGRAAPVPNIAPQNTLGSKIAAGTAPRAYSQRGAAASLPEQGRRPAPDKFRPPSLDPSPHSPHPWVTLAPDKSEHAHIRLENRHGDDVVQPCGGRARCTVTPGGCTTDRFLPHERSQQRMATQRSQIAVATGAASQPTIFHTNKDTWQELQRLHQWVGGAALLRPSTHRHRPGLVFLTVSKTDLLLAR